MSSSVENFFKDKINWKFLHFLIDKSTEIEDMGGVVSISACVRNGGINVPFYWQKNEEYTGHLESLIEYYKSGKGIYYYIYVYRKVGTYSDAQLTNEYFNKIKNKCVRIDVSGLLIYEN